MIRGLNHITLAVRDVAEAFAFYTALLGFKPLARWPKGAYLLGGGVWIALQLDEYTRREPLPEYTHIAWTVSPDDFPRLAQRLIDVRVELWQENRTEGDSLYFLDPNGHKLEVHASDLTARLASAKAAPWEGLEFFV